jgi:hypothetical protein
MSNLKPIDARDATGKTKELLDFVQQRSSRADGELAGGAWSLSELCGSIPRRNAPGQGS